MGVVLGVLLTLVLAARMVQLREMVFGEGLGLLDVLRLLGYLSPFFLLELLPVGSLLAVFLTFLRLAADRELLALKAHGISLMQMTPAPLIFLLLVAAADFGVGAYGLSWGADGFRATAMDMARSQAKVLVQPGMFVSEMPGMTFYADQVDQESGHLGGVFIRDERKDGEPMVIVAPEGVLLTGEGDSVTGLLLNNGTIHRLEGEAMSNLRFERYLLTLKDDGTGAGSEGKQRLPREMSLNRLRDLAKEPDGGEFGRKVLVELQRRFSVPVSCLALGLLALPLASVFAGVRQQVGLVLALVVFLGYYAVLLTGKTLAEIGMLPVFPGVWLANALVLAGAGWSMSLAQAERTPWPALLIMRLLSPRPAAEAPEQSA